MAVLSGGTSASFSYTLTWFNAAPSRRTIPNFKARGQHSGPDVDVMDSPSSVITQVSRDDEGSKAAGEKGEFLFIFVSLGLCDHVKKK